WRQQLSDMCLQRALSSGPTTNDQRQATKDERLTTSNQRRFHRGRNPALVVTQGYRPSPPAQLLASIPHDNRIPSKLKHLNVIVIITDGHDLFASVAAVRSPSLQGMSF